MGGKDQCRVTTGRLKARIPRNVCPFVSVTKQYIPICGADSRMIPNLLTDSAAVFFVFFVFVCFLFFFFLFLPRFVCLFVFCSFVCFCFFVRLFLWFFSILLQCTGCALNYYSIYHCCQNERMCVRERGWGVTALLWSRLFRLLNL